MPETVYFLQIDFFGDLVSPGSEAQVGVAASSIADLVKKVFLL